MRSPRENGGDEQQRTFGRRSREDILKKFKPPGLRRGRGPSGGPRFVYTSQVDAIAIAGGLAVVALLWFGPDCSGVEEADRAQVRKVIDMAKSKVADGLEKAIIGDTPDDVPMVP